eukprot:2798218-Rhodomonas_salina.2
MSIAAAHAGAAGPTAPLAAGAEAGQRSEEAGQQKWRGGGDKRRADTRRRGTPERAARAAAPPKIAAP